nr:hypothetical protein [uncultured Roseococcus sp.]
MIRRTLFALLAVGATALTPARAATPELLELAGQPVLELARNPLVGPRLRAMTGGRQRIVSDAVRGPGSPLAITGSWIHGMACPTTGCDEARIFLAFDTQTETVVIMLLEKNRPSLFIPPRVAPWPAVLEPAIREFSPELAAVMRFRD